jgi:hypothetical protein
VQFDYAAQFCSKCGERLELQRVLCDFEYGDLRARMHGASVIARLDNSVFQNILSELNSYLASLKPKYALEAAMALQSDGVRLPSVTQILLSNMRPESWAEFSEEERKHLLDVMSTFRNDPVVAKWLMEEGRSDWALRETILCLLGAIGDPETKPFVAYWATRGEAEAVAALQLFGKAKVAEIMAFAKRYKRLR